MPILSLNPKASATSGSVTAQAQVGTLTSQRKSANSGTSDKVKVLSRISSSTSVLLHDITEFNDQSQCSATANGSSTDPVNKSPVVPLQGKQLKLVIT